MPPININAIYKQVCSFTNDVQDVVPHLFAGKSVQPGVEPPGTETMNREFREALYKSLSETGVDKTVLDGLRAKLGMPEKGEVSGQSLSSRDVKDAIESVMTKVSGQIEAVLGKKLPFGVQPLILEAVRENPTHPIVKDFLNAGKDGQTMKLARLCRLAAISQAKASATKSWELGYLEGFSYQVKDVDAQSVRLVGEGPGFQDGFEQGKGDFDARVKQDQENQAGQDVGDMGSGNQVKTEEKGGEIGKKDGDEVSQEDFDKCMAKIKKGHEERDACEAIKAFGTKIKNKGYGKTLCSMPSQVWESLGVNLDEISKWKSSFEQKAGDVLKVDEKVDIFIEKLMSKDKNKIAGDGIRGVLQDAKDAFQLVVLLRAAVKGCEEPVSDLKRAVDEGGSQLMKNEKNKFLEEVEKLKSLSPAGTLCTKLCEVKDKAQKKPDSTVQTVVQEMTQALKKAIKQKIELQTWNIPESSGTKMKGLSRLDDITDKLVSEDNGVDNKTFYQGRTNMCYVRSVENSLLATKAGREILLKQVGRKIDNYFFSVNLGNGKGLMVTSTEIEALKKWYAKNHPVDADVLKDLKESDWAVNLAIAKVKMFKAVAQEMVEDAKNLSTGKKPTEAEVMAKIKELNALSVSEDGTKLGSGYEVELQGQKKTYNYQGYLEDQLIVNKGYDTDVAELFGLGEANESVAINFIPEGGKPDPRMKELSKEGIFSNWNSVREWLQGNKDGVVTLNLGSLHTVAVSSCYYNNDNDFGFCVRDSQNPDAEQRINVIGYGKKDDGMCSTLNVHCYALPSSLLS